MPLTEKGKAILARLKEKYGKARAGAIFYGPKGVQSKVPGVHK